MSDPKDPTFVPFNFSTLVPFDAVAVALQHLPTPQLAEPVGDFTHFARHDLPTEQPSQPLQSDMISLITHAAREWGDVDSQTLVIENSNASRQNQHWAGTFSRQLSASLQHVQKRPTKTSPPRQTPKRPRHPSTSSPSKPHTFSTPRHAQQRTPDNRSSRMPETRKLALRQDLSHEREVRMRKMLNDVDADERNDFSEYLVRFIRRPKNFFKQTNDSDDAVLLATASENTISELRQRVVLFAGKHSMALMDAQLLSQVISILQKRIVESSRECSVARPIDTSKATAVEAALGVLCASTALAILCAPGSPRRLLVEELLDDVMSLLKNCATNVIFPVCDPLYKASKTPKRRKKGSKDRRTSTRVQPHHEVTSSKVRGSDDEYDAKRTSTPRRALLKKEESLINDLCAMLSALTDLFEKEHNLPDSVVSAASTVCLQSLSVTGIARLQAHTMRTTCVIFQWYPQQRLPILDDLREAASAIPANRRHLRPIKLPEDQTSVRASSALLAQLLCLGSPPKRSEGKPTSKEAATTDPAPGFLKQGKDSHDMAIRLAMHVLTPMLQRVCSDRDAEYRTAFQSLFEDMLTLYGRPEWPSAELVLQTVSVSLITKLRAQKERSVYARSIAIDLLGALAAQMCTLYGSRIFREAGAITAESEKPVSLEGDRALLLLYLNPDVSNQFAGGNSFCEILFACDDYNTASNADRASRKAAEERQKQDEDNCDEVLDGQEGSQASIREVFEKLEDAAKERARNVAERRLKGEDVSRVVALNVTQSIGRRRSFTLGIETIIEAILDGMHDPAPTVRAKSIKALSAVDEVCSGIIQAVPDVMKFIEASCRDVSTLARDAALDLLGRALLRNPGGVLGSADGQDSKESKERSDPIIPETMIGKIFAVVEKRLCDASTSVRKRAISILRTVLTHSLQESERLRNSPMSSVEASRDVGQHETKVMQICASLVCRLDDPETTVREAAERTLRLGLFGTDSSEGGRMERRDDNEEAVQLATRFVTVFSRLPAGIHVSFISRIIDKSWHSKKYGLLSSIVTAVVEQIHDCEATMAKLQLQKEPKKVPEVVKLLSMRRVACCSVVYAFGELDKCLVVPHCRSLAPSVKHIHEQGTSENELLCVQKILNVLQIGLESSDEFDRPFLEEVMHDVETIVCTSPLPILEEAAVKCFCVISRKIAMPDENPLDPAAESFGVFLRDNLGSLKSYCSGPMPSRPAALERNARGALVRLGLLMRYGDFGPAFISDVHRTLEDVCHAVCVVAQRDTLSRAAVRSLSHFIIRHRSYLPSATGLFVSVWESSVDTGKNPADLKRNAGEGVQLSILQGFHDLLRSEEERNSRKQNEGSSSKFSGGPSNLPTRSPGPTPKNDTSGHQHDAQDGAPPVLAAEEDAEAGYLALSAQAMMQSIKSAVNNSSVAVRRMVANILGLLVRQGLLLPASVVTELFTLLLDRDATCREYSQRVIAFLADRHLGMLASAAIPALRVCFEKSFAVQAEEDKTKEVRKPFNGIVNDASSANFTDVLEGRSLFSTLSSPTVDQILTMTTDRRSGHSLLSPALMTMRREQRRGVLESIMREFDPRVVLRLKSPTENSNDTRLQEDDQEAAMRSANGRTSDGDPRHGDVVRIGSDDDDDYEDDVGAIGPANSAEMDLSAAEMKCSIPTLLFLAITLATLDYTNGAGVGGSLGQGGGTGAADVKLRYAREDVTELVSIATRIISNSGQAILRMASHIRKGPLVSGEKRIQAANQASRMAVLLSLKHHLKVERWKPLLSAEEVKEEGDLASNRCQMPSFRPDGSLLPFSSWNAAAIPTMTEEIANKQLDLFCKLMKADAIDDNDISAPSRKRGKTARRRSSISQHGSIPRPIEKPFFSIEPSPRRIVHRRKISAARKATIEEASDANDSDYEPS